MKRVLRDAVYAALISISAGAVPAFAQLDTGSIVGTVRDQSAAVVPGATVTATQESTGSVSTAVTTEKGQFVFPNLKIGTYSIGAELSGFRKSVQTGIVLHVQERLEVDVRIELGNVTEEVVVRGVSPLLQTQTADVGIRRRSAPGHRPAAARAPLRRAGASDPRCGDGAGRHHQTRRGHVLQRQRQPTRPGTTSSSTARDNNSAPPTCRSAARQVVQPPVDALEEFQRADAHLFGGVRQGRRRGDQRLDQAGQQRVPGERVRVLPRRGVQREPWENNRADRPKGAFNQHIAGGTLGGPIVARPHVLLRRLSGDTHQPGADTACRRCRPI